MIGRIRLGIGLGVLIAASACASSAMRRWASARAVTDWAFTTTATISRAFHTTALYPPVYYSYPVARPYGFSPFAYPPGVMTPNAAPTSAAVEYRNPYVPSNAAPATSEDRTATLGRMYINPYVAAGQRAGGAALAKQEPR